MTEEQWQRYLCRIRAQDEMNAPIFYDWLRLLPGHDGDKFVLMRNEKFMLREGGEVEEEKLARCEFMLIEYGNSEENGPGQVIKSGTIVGVLLDGQIQEGYSNDEIIENLLFDSVEYACDEGFDRFGDGVFSVFRVVGTPGQGMESALGLAWENAGGFSFQAAAVSELNAVRAAEEEEDKKRAEEMRARMQQDREASSQALTALIRAEEDVKRKRKAILKKISKEFWREFWEDVVRNLTQQVEKGM